MTGGISYGKGGIYNYGKQSECTVFYFIIKGKYKKLHDKIDDYWYLYAEPHRKDDVNSYEAKTGRNFIWKGIKILNY